MVRNMGLAAGERIVVEPDYVVINNNHNRVWLEVFKEKVVNPHKFNVVIDHYVPSGDPMYTRDMSELYRVSKQFGFSYTYGKGMADQYMSETLELSGKLIATTSPYFGVYAAEGGVGIQVNDRQLQQLMYDGVFHYIVPQIIKVDFTGELSNGVTTTDVGLFLVKLLQEHKGRKAIVFGSKMKDLFNKNEQLIILSMMSETAAVSVEYADFEKADADIVVNLGAVEQVLALPESLSGIAEGCMLEKVSAMHYKPIDYVYLGGYIGGNIEALRKAATMVAGKHIHLGTRMNISPLSANVYLQALEEGLIDRFIEFGAQIIPSGDHSELLQGAGVMGHNEVGISTGFSNYTSCLGGRNTTLYIAAPQVAVQAAVDGFIGEDK